MSDADDALRAALQDRLRFERLVCDLAARFVNLAPDGVDGEIQDAQRQIVEALDLDRSTLFQLSETDDTWTYTHFWGRTGLPPQIDVPLAEAFPWSMARIRRGEMLRFETVDELPADSPDRESIRRTGTKSNVTVPLKVGGTVVGALAFGSVREERAWPPEVVNRLILLGQVFASALARKRADLALNRALDENARLREQLLEENVYLQQEVKVLHGPG